MRSVFFRFRSRGRCRVGRPRVSREVGELIVRIARENFLWGAPRIHGELLMLGLMFPRRPYRAICRDRQVSSTSWTTFIRNEAMACSLFQSLPQDSASEVFSARESV